VPIHFLHETNFTPLSRSSPDFSACPRRSRAQRRSKFFGGRERQAAFAVEKFFQPLVAGTSLTPDDAGHDKLAAFATRATAFEPVNPTGRAFNRDAGDF
jgi:hypothetical protein